MRKLLLSILTFIACAYAVSAQSFEGDLPAGSTWANPNNSSAPAQPSNRGKIVTTDYGMSANDGHDNSANVQALYNAMSGSSTAWGAKGLFGYNFNFPAKLGTDSTEYYFSDSFSYQRAGALICDNGEKYNNQVSVKLIFAPGRDGVIQDLDPNYADGTHTKAWASNNIKGCQIQLLGKWYGAATAGGSTVSGLSDYSATAHYSDTQGWRVDDGVIVTNAKWNTPVIATSITGTKVASVGANSITLAGGATLSTTRNVYAWRLPKELAYSASYTINSAKVTLSSGPARMLMPGDMVWTDAAPLGTIISQTSGMTYPQTIWFAQIDQNHEQRASYTGTGKLWLIPAGIKRRQTSMAENNFIQHFPVGEQMTCSSGFRIGAADSWTFDSWVASTAYALNQEVTNDSGKTYIVRTAGTSAGSGGPTGTGTGITDGTVVWDYVGPTTYGDVQTGQNCTGSTDRAITAWGGLIGRYVAGNNTAPSGIYDFFAIDNYGADLVELGGLGSSYYSAMLHSWEQGTGRDFNFLHNCRNQNYSVFIGGYLTTNNDTNGSCVDPTNPFVNPPAHGGAGSPLFIEPTARTPNDGWRIMNGQFISNSSSGVGWRFNGNGPATDPIILMKPTTGGFFDWYYNGTSSPEIGALYDSTRKLYSFAWPATPGRIYFGFTKYNGNDYLGDGWGYPTAPKGLLLQDSATYDNTNSTLLSATNALQTDAYRKRGDIQIKNNASAGGYAGWYGTVAGGTFRPFAPIANDASGNQWTLPEVILGGAANKHYASLDACGDGLTGAAAYIDDGTTAWAHAGSIGGGGGSVKSLVFCDGTNWLYQ